MRKVSRQSAVSIGLRAQIIVIELGKLFGWFELSMRWTS